MEVPLTQDRYADVEEMGLTWKSLSPARGEKLLDRSGRVDNVFQLYQQEVSGLFDQSTLGSIKALDVFVDEPSGVRSVRNVWFRYQRRKPAEQLENGAKCIEACVSQEQVCHKLLQVK